MSFLTKLFIIPLGCTLAFAAQQEPTYDLIWHPRSDDAMTYKMRVDIEGTPEMFSFLVNVKSHVLKVKPNGDYDVETVIKDGHVLHGSHDDPIPNDDKPTVDTYNARGEKIASSEENDPTSDSDPGFAAIDDVTDQLTPKTPVALGGTWTATIKANPKQKREAAKVNYTLAAKVKEGAYQTLKIDFKYRETDKENPASVEGFVLVSQDDFSFVRFEGTLKGVLFSDDPDFPKGDSKISVIRN
jgi:hypothetical protein